MPKKEFLKRSLKGLVFAKEGGEKEIGHSCGDIKWLVLLRHFLNFFKAFCKSINSQTYFTPHLYSLRSTLNKLALCVCPSSFCGCGDYRDSAFLTDFRDFLCAGFGCVTL